MVMMVVVWVMVWVMTVIDDGVVWVMMVVMVMMVIDGWAKGVLRFAPLKDRGACGSCTEKTFFCERERIKVGSQLLL